MWIGNEAIVKHEQYRDLQREAAQERLVRQAQAPRQGSAVLTWLLRRVQPLAEGIPTARRPSLDYRPGETTAQ
jgi:hypothetical protein